VCVYICYVRIQELEQGAALDFFVLHTNLDFMVRTKRVRS
jgi:hypothetical protein